MTAGHQPVLLEEALGALDLGERDLVVDATFGGGGHARRILERLGPAGRLIGLDRDPEAAERAELLASTEPRFSFRGGAYDRLLESMARSGERLDAILFDLGVSSFQVDDAERGFSYVREGPLDMRMDPRRGKTAAEWLNEADADQIIEALVLFGDVPRGEARRIAEAIASRRPLAATPDLTDAVRAAVGWKERGGNPSKRVFQAVRMQINDELGGLGRALEASERLLVPGGRLVVIAFHSAEDRLVKRFIADREGRCVCPPELPVCVCGARPTLRRGVVMRPSRREVEGNPRSASARLRSAVRTSEPLGLQKDPR